MVQLSGIMGLLWSESPTDRASISSTWGEHQKKELSCRVLQYSLFSRVFNCSLLLLPLMFKWFFLTSWTKWKSLWAALASKHDQCLYYLKLVLVCVLQKVLSLKGDFSFWINENRRCEMRPPNLSWLKQVWSIVGCLSKWYMIIWKQIFITQDFYPFQTGYYEE